LAGSNAEQNFFNLQDASCSRLEPWHTHGTESRQGWSQTFQADNLRSLLQQHFQDLVTRAFSLAEFERMILAGTIRDGVTIASFGLLRLKGLL